VCATPRMHTKKARRGSRSSSQYVSCYRRWRYGTGHRVQSRKNRRCHNAELHGKRRCHIAIAELKGKRGYQLQSYTESGASTGKIITPDWKTEDAEELLRCKESDCS
jgi:hypothetical protein